MSLTNKATNGHLRVGIMLITIAVAFLLLCLFNGTRLYSVGVFFFGVWGGIETGRYLESYIRNRPE